MIATFFFLHLPMYIYIYKIWLIVRWEAQASLINIKTPLGLVIPNHVDHLCCFFVLFFCALLFRIDYLHCFFTLLCCVVGSLYCCCYWWFIVLLSLLLVHCIVSVNGTCHIASVACGLSWTFVVDGLLHY